jgi:enoyl-[acyl-carrier protein] reductase I
MMTDIMKGRRGLIMGVANDHSIAWGIAQKLYQHGAELAFTYQGEAFGRRVKPLAAKVDSNLVFPCDVEDLATVGEVFAGLEKVWGSLDFLVHAIAQLMPSGGAMLTLTYGGSRRVMPNYNVMGIAKASLEASVRYLAADFGPKGIRVNAISAGPMRTLAGSGIGDARVMFNFQKRHSPLRRTVTLDDVGGAGLYLLSPLSAGVTGEIHYVDSGYNIISTPRPEDLKGTEADDLPEAAQ